MPKGGRRRAAGCSEWGQTRFPSGQRDRRRNLRRRTYLTPFPWACGHAQDGFYNGPMDGKPIEHRLGIDVSGAISAATEALLKEQRPDGHWVYELEADATIPAEYVLLVHYLGETPNLELEKKIGIYLRRIRGAHGGWPLYHEGAFDISATVKAYFALKMIGDDIDAPHMARAREEIRKRGGAIKANVFTRILLALYGA